MWTLSRQSDRGASRHATPCPLTTDATLHPLPGIDLTVLDFSQALSSPEYKEILRQNDVIV